MTGPTTILVYGASGAGKTEFAATFPRCIMLSMAQEGGHATLATMAKHRAAKFADGKPPEVLICGSGPEVILAAKRIQKDGQHRSLVIDSVTFLAEAVKLANPPSPKDPYAHWNAVDNTLSVLVDILHRPPFEYVLWLALADDPNPEKSIQGGPLLQGRQNKLLAARCNSVGYLRLAGKQRTLHFVPYGQFSARTRDDFPDTITDPTFHNLYKGVSE